MQKFYITLLSQSVDIFYHVGATPSEKIYGEISQKWTFAPWNVKKVLQILTRLK